MFHMANLRIRTLMFTIDLAEQLTVTLLGRFWRKTIFLLGFRLRNSCHLEFQKCSCITFNAHVHELVHVYMYTSVYYLNHCTDLLASYSYSCWSARMGERKRYREYHRSGDAAMPRTTAWRLKKHAISVEEGNRESRE